MNNYYFGIDIGGTFVKSGIIDNNNNLVSFFEMPTADFKLNNNCADEVYKIINHLADDYNISIKDACGVGIGIKGLIDAKNGIVINSTIISSPNYPLKNELEKLTNLPVEIANDADVAILAEQAIGAGKNYKDIIMLTIGTGIGGGIIIDNKNLGTKYSKPVEIGHIKISNTNTGKRCTECGEYGCYELFGSTNALISQMKTALKKHPECEILKHFSLDEINGKIIFDYIQDETVKNVLNDFIKYVSSGIISLINIFKPEIIIIGGAISKQEEYFIKPVKNYVNNHTFLRFMGYEANIVPAKSTGNAGVIGTKFLFN